MIQRLPRALDGHEIRVLGCLLEKQQATPEYYPLTLNALVAACNQKNNRNPVLNLSEQEVQGALRGLYDAGLVTRETGGRAVRWRQEIDRRLRLEGPQKAALTVLLLRGPQTEAEVRARSERLHAFATFEAVQGALADLAAPPDPLVVLLEREPGQKEQRWGHRLGIEESQSMTEAAPSGTPQRAPARGFDADLVMRRLDRIEQQVQQLQAALDKPGLFD